MRKLALLTALFAASFASPGWSLDRVDTRRLVHAVTSEKIVAHLKKLQEIASRNDNTRALGTRGYDASVRYVVNRLVRARYSVYVQPFIAALFKENTPPELVRLAPTNRVYVADTDFTTLQYSGAGDVTASLALAGGIVIPPTPDPSSASGCLASDFPAVSGRIVLIQRGTCTFEVKVQNAANAGAVGVILFNEGQPGREDLFGGTLANEQPIPAVATSFAVGSELYALVNGGATVQLRLAVDAETTPIRTFNVIAEKRGRVDTQNVVVGAHLDSVPEGPGINDNGSGTAVLLTIAEQMTRLHIRPRNTLRFAFWGAEEEGLFGSNYYVANLEPTELDRIAVNLNFDMLGSRNFARFVYDGDGTLGAPGPAGSDIIEKVFTDYFNRRRLASEPTPFDGRSDYFAFINAGIPAGGLFSGAEGIKTPAQKRRYGGTAGEAYDSCYHQACDTIRNVSRRSLDQLGKAAAHAVQTFAATRQDIRPAAAQRTAASAAARSADYRGPNLIR